MRVRLSKQARADVLTALRWWKTNLGSIPSPLVAELERARVQLERLPHSGVVVEDAGWPGVRRLALWRARYSLFYEVDEANGVVTVLRVWHTSRRGQPTRSRP